MLQVWTRFAIFGEIHYFPFPKILRKFRQSLDASRGHPTKFHLKKKFPRAPNISSNSWCALFLFKFRVQCSVQSIVLFSSEPRCQSRQCTRWHLAPCSSFLSSAPQGRLAGRERRWRRVSPAPASSTVAEPHVAISRDQPCHMAPSSTAHTTRSLCVAVLFSMCAAEPSSWPERCRARSLPSTSP